MPRPARPAPPPLATPPAEPTLEGAFSPGGVDLTVIRWMLALTPTQRLAAAQDMIDAAWALRQAGEA
jgi:hypothetical protein